MDRNVARNRYHAQRVQAGLRGIGWELTFQQWLDWWGEDLDRRGTKPWQLSMQRIGDSGPYRLDNIRKGTPQQNADTRTKVASTKRTSRLARELEAARDADPGTSPPPDEMTEDEQWLKENLGLTPQPCWGP